VAGVFFSRLGQSISSWDASNWHTCIVGMGSRRETKTSMFVKYCSPFFGCVTIEHLSIFIAYVSFQNTPHVKAPFWLGVMFLVIWARWTMFRTSQNQMLLLWGILPVQNLWIRSKHVETRIILNSLSPLFGTWDPFASHIHESYPDVQYLMADEHVVFFTCDNDHMCKLAKTRLNFPAGGKPR
jgi:hypothetical protein